VKTGPRASAKIRYPDGSKLLIGRATEMEIQESANGAQFNQLNQGEVRGIIRKPKVLLKDGPPRFIIRSKAAVMGVRGTDFVFTLDEEAKASQVHTLEGTVEVAKDEPTLMAGKGTPVTQDQMVSADAQGVRVPTSFDRKLYDQVLQTAQPEFAALEKGDPDIRSAAETPVVLNPRIDDKPKLARIRLLEFRGNGVFAKQHSGGESISPQLSWNPVIDLIWPLSVRGHFGAMVLKGATRDDKFVGVEAGLLASLNLLDPVVIEAGGGVESWGDHAKEGPVIMANVGLRIFGDESLLERIFVGVGVYDSRPDGAYVNGPINDNMTVLVRAGIGVQF
jgi:hypothetical protein